MTPGLLKIAGSLLLLVLVLAAMRELVRHLKIHPEFQRKAVHASLGLYALTFPLIFSHSWEVGTLCGATIILMMLIRLVPALRARLGGSLHGVDRVSLGEIFFAFSVALLFALKGNQPVFYILPLLILTLSDAAAALIGTVYAISSFKIEDGTKSWEGTGFFFLTAWLLSLIALLTLSGLPRDAIVPVAFIIALFGTLIEATSWRGLDNLFVPVGLFLLLENIAFLPVPHLLGISATFLTLLGASLWTARKFRVDLHTINTFATAAFFFWIVGGWANLGAPLAVFATHLYFRRRDGTNDLPVVLSIIGTALFWYIVNALTGYNTYYVYNLSFALHLVMLVTLHANGRRVIPVMLAVFVAWMVTNVRVLFIPGFQPQDLRLSLAALALLILFAACVNASRPFFATHRWRKQAGTVLAISSLGIPITLWL